MNDVPAPAAWRSRAGHVVGRVLVLALYAARAVGSSHVPRRGPVILAANHTGYLDGAVVLAMAPRPSHFLVLARTFEGFVGHLLHGLADGLAAGPEPGTQALAFGLKVFGHLADFVGTHVGRPPRT